MKNKPELIAIVNKAEKLTKPSENYNRTEPEISVSIGRLEANSAGAKTPRNYSHQYDEPDNTSGGQFARIFASFSSYDNKTSSIFAYYGPSIAYGAEKDYERAAKGLSKVAKKLDKIYELRGSTIDTADALGRWLEATGIESVWSRPDGQDNEWLNKGEWRQETIGSFINRIRTLLPDN
jgi:hypothetical protein